MRELDPEDLRARVGVRVEVDEADGPRDRSARPHVRLRDRMVAAEDYRKDVGGQHLPDRALDRRVRADRIRRDDGCVAEVDDTELGERIDPDLNAGPGLEARAPDSARAKASPRPVGDEVVRGSADDGDVHARKVGRILGPRDPGIRQQPRIVGLPEAAPASSRVEHAPMLCGTGRGRSA